ncbi:unnamed protein product, partial [Iphiclides podalirius]
MFDWADNIPREYLNQPTPLYAHPSDVQWPWGALHEPRDTILFNIRGPFVFEKLTEMMWFFSILLGILAVAMAQDYEHQVHPQLIDRVKGATSITSSMTIAVGWTGRRTGPGFSVPTATPATWGARSTGTMPTRLLLSTSASKYTDLRLLTLVRVAAGRLGKTATSRCWVRTGRPLGSLLTMAGRPYSTTAGEGFHTTFVKRFQCI